MLTELILVKVQYENQTLKTLANDPRNSGEDVMDDSV